MREKVQREGKIKPTRYYSSKQETAVAKAVNGKKTLNSGATPFSKGDVLAAKVLLECKTKTSDSESMAIKKEWLEKNEKEALFMGKPYNALVFNFGPGQKNYYVIDEYMFQLLLEAINNSVDF